MRLARQDEDGFGAPYWAHYWAGGLALARYVLDHPGVVAGRRVLDLGAGSGLVGIAAAKAGAREVVAAEVDGYAVAALRLNMKLNDASISVLHSDVTECAARDRSRFWSATCSTRPISQSASQPFSIGVRAGGFARLSAIPGGPICQFRA